MRKERQRSLSTRFNGKRTKPTPNQLEKESICY